MNKKFWQVLNVVVIIALVIGLLATIAYFNQEIQKLSYDIYKLTNIVDDIVTFLID